MLFTIETETYRGIEISICESTESNRFCSKASDTICGFFDTKELAIKAAKNKIDSLTKEVISTRIIIK